MIIISRRLCFGHKARFYCSCLGESLVKVLVGAGSEGCVSLGVVVVLVELIRTDGRTEKTMRVRVGSESAK